MLDHDHANAASQGEHGAMNTSNQLPAGGVGSASNGRVLRIVAGLHAGASRPLAEQEMLVVGSGDDCDIVLADTGVAAHHALVTLVGGVFTLRALDAPLRIEGRPLHPGDPVEVRPMQRIDLGEAAIAFGGSDASAWDALFPAIAEPGRRRRARPLLRQLPLIAAGAVVALLLVAVVASVLPRRNAQVDERAFLQALVPQHAITDSAIRTDENGRLVLAGTVETDAVRSKVQQQLQEAGVEASLALRTGENISGAVREVFRASGMSVQTRYLGAGRVEISGDELDQQKFNGVLRSRAMADVGASELVAGERLTASGAATEAAGKTGAVTPDQAPVDIVSVVRGGKTPYVVDSEGNQYPNGAVIPGHGRLTAIGAQIWVMGTNGELKQIRPITSAELAARAEAARGADFSNVNRAEASVQQPPAVNAPAQNIRPRAPARQ